MILVSLYCVLRSTCHEEWLVIRIILTFEASERTWEQKCWDIPDDVSDRRADSPELNQLGKQEG